MSSLSGLRIVVTRAAHQAEELARPLRELGASVILLPTVGIGPPEDSGPLIAAASQADEFDWIIFTSQNAISAYATHWVKGNASRFKVAAIGRATCEAAERSGFNVALVPESYVAESLLQAFDCLNLHGKRILIPSAAVTRDVIPGELEKRGATVTVVEAYRNIVPVELAQRAAAVLTGPLPDWILFASASAMDNLARTVPVEQWKQIKVATIGPVTTRAVEKWGVVVAAEANPYNVGGLVAAVQRCSLQ